MKKVLSVITAFILLSCLLSLAGYADEEFIIDDAANLFDEMQEGEITSSLLTFSLETSYSAAVVTTENAQGKSSQEFADDYYDNLEGWNQNGILLLIDMDNREVCISTMGECISLYTDSIDYIIDSGYDELVSGNYSDCILLMIDAAYECKQNSGGNYYDEFYNDDYYIFDDGYYGEEVCYSDTVTHSSGINIGNIAACIVIAIVIAAVSVFAVKSKYKNTGKGDEFDADDIILNLTASNDTVISRNVITTRVPRNNNNHHNRHGGGFSGGASHRSSGGFSHGGGSRKF